MSDRRESRTLESVVRALPLAVCDHQARVRLAGGADVGGLAGNLPESLEGSSLTELVHPHDLVIVLEQYAAVRDQQTSIAEVRTRVRGPDGAYRDVVLTMHALTGTSDVLVWCRDVTASVMAEEALRANALHSALVEQTRALLAVFEVDGSLRFVNPSALDLFEQAYHHVNGVASLTDIVHPDDVDTVRARFDEAVGKPRRRVSCNVRIQYGDQWRTLHMEFVNLVEDPAVRGIVADAIDITDELDLAHRALHDPLTGLANRVLLQDRLEHAAANLKREQLPLMVGYVDLDRFKVINDTLGHECGDLVLQEVARRLTASLRPGDTVARIGGDEFVVVCPGLPEGATADEVTQRLLLAIAQPIDLGNETRTLTASIGVLVLDSPLETGAVLQAADAAMYRAKRAGGNFGVRTRR